MNTHFDPFQRHHIEATTAASQPSATINAASPQSGTGPPPPWRDYAYDFLTPGEQEKFRAELNQSMRDMLRGGICGRNVQWLKDAALLAGIRELAAHTTI